MGKIKQNHIVICMEKTSYLQKEMLKIDQYKRAVRGIKDTKFIWLI